MYHMYDTHVQYITPWDHLWRGGGGEGGIKKSEPFLFLFHKGGIIDVLFI